jgi:cytochrome c oxidase cbb3-type subunit 4
MDINTLRGLSTILVMIVFIGICLWAFNGKKKKDFDDAANLPFQDDEIAQRTLNETERKNHD